LAGIKTPCQLNRQVHYHSPGPIIPAQDS
jgi:hypothetical protein